jgi:hypothetical protein
MLGRPYSVVALRTAKLGHFFGLSHHKHRAYRRFLTEACLR